MKTAPNIPITRFGAGVQSFWTTEKDLPVGIVPSMIKSWHEVVMNGHFLVVKCAEARSLLKVPKSIPGLLL